jgi:AcrR family transcriptional regulator
MGSHELDLSGLQTQRHTPQPGRRAAVPSAPLRRGRPAAAALIRGALIDLCFERGFGAIEAGDVCRRAGLSPAVFRSHFASLEDCFVWVCACELRRYRGVAATAVAGVADWRARLRATAYALYRSLTEDERRRRFTLVEARIAGERSALLLHGAVESLYDLIDQGRDEPAARRALTRATAEFVGGAIFNGVYLASARGGPLPPEREAVPEMMYLAVLPYLGSTAARAELTIPPPSL